MGMKQTVLSKLNAIFPKKNQILFSSFPDGSDNAIALYEYILRERKDIVNNYNLIWSSNELPSEELKEYLICRTGSQNHKVVKKASILGLFAYFTSKYIVSTHGYFNGVKTAKNQIHINLWHGMPFKRIGYMLRGENYSGINDEADITIATSELFQNIMAESFGIEKDHVLITGLPRNDYLSASKPIFKNLGIDNYKKVICWMPTYRKSVVGDVRMDGNTNSFGVTDLIEKHFDELNKILRELGFLLIIKPHPMDELCSHKLPQSNNIWVVHNEFLHEKHIELYELLAGCDLLITDYSSVFIDFFETGKPMAFVISDLMDYQRSRGFCFDNPLDYIPGEIISNYEEFIAYIQNIDSYADKWKIKYEQIRKEFNPMVGGKACERICEAFWS